jgi:uncharacterized membrane protein
MSEPPTSPPAPPAEDRVLPAIVYVLFLIGPSNGLTMLIGLILAYASIGAAGPKVWSHYVFLIRTFWTTVVWAVLGGMVVALGGLLAFLLIGFPIMGLGALIIGAAGLWFFIRTVVGVVYLAQDQAYPRPRAWLI